MRRPVAALAAVEIAVVAAVAHGTGRHGTGATVTAIVLAPLAVWVVAGIGTRLAGPRFGVAAAAVYVVLPVAGRLYFYGAFEPVYRHDVTAALVGLRAPWWFALGVGLAIVVRLAPARVAGVLAVAAAAVALVVDGSANWTALYGNFHESTWSPTLLCLLPVAAVIGAAQRAPWLAACLGGWLGVLVLRGVHRPYEGGGFWFALAAGTPALAVLVTSLALLVPRLRPAPLRADAAAGRAAP